MGQVSAQLAMLKSNRLQLMTRRRRSSGGTSKPGSTAPRVSPVIWAASMVLLLVVIAAVIGPLISPAFGSADYLSGAQHPQLSWRYLLGSDVSGRPILSFVLSGARTTFGIGFLASLIAVAGGSILVVLSEVHDGLRDLVDFVTDLGLLMPFLPLLVVLAAFEAGGNPWALTGLYGLVGIPVAVILLSQRPRPRPAGAPIRPAAGGLIAVPTGSTAKLIRAFVICLVCLLSVSATIDFLGFGLPGSDPSWGNALSDVLDYLGGGYWWWLAFPGLALFITLTAVTLLGSAALQALEPAEGGSSPHS